MGDISKAIQAMYWAANSDQVGYSQSDRESLQEWNFFGEGLFNTDCSKLDIECLQYAGYETGWASYTGNMKPALEANGWTFIRPNGNPQPGYVLLNEGNHAALMLYDGDLGQASIDENNDISGGDRGDQTGWEVNVRPYYDFPWDWYGIPPEYETPEGSSDDYTEPTAEWQGDMIGLKDTTDCGDDYAGELGKPILNIAIEGVGKYQASDVRHLEFWPYVEKYDLNDEENGFAGDNWPIDCLRIPDPTVYYQLHELGKPLDEWHEVMHGLVDSSKCGDDYAGEQGKQHDLVRIWRAEGQPQPRYNVFS